MTTKESDEAEGATASRRDEESDEEADGAGLPKSGVFARPRMLKAEIQGPGEATVSVEIAIPGQYPWEAPSVSVAACSGVGEDVTEALRKQVPAAVAEAQRSLAATLKVSGGDGIGDRASTAKAIADVLGRPPGFGPDPSWAFAEVAVTASIAVAALAGLKCMEETAGGG